MGALSVPCRTIITGIGLKREHGVKNRLALFPDCAFSEYLEGRATPKTFSINEL